MNSENTMLDISKSRGIEFWKYLLSARKADLEKLFSKNLSEKDKIEFCSKILSIINIETSSKCNRKCDYCPDSIYNRETQNILSHSHWNKILINLKKMEYKGQVSLNLYNEPMLDPYIYERIKSLRKAAPLCEIKISSNGDYLNFETLSNLAEAGLNSAYITFHTAKGDDYNDSTQEGYLRKFLRRSKINYEDIEIQFSPGKYIKSNYLFNKKLLLVMLSNNWGDFGNDRGGSVIKLSRKIQRNNPCMRVFREFTISHLGDVFPCCQIFPDAPESKKFVLGNIADYNIEDINFSENFIAWRKSLFDFSKKSHPCSSCKDPDNSTIESDGYRKYFINR